jgi:hypothetical protein
MLLGRQEGPLEFRLIVQPIIAAIFAVRAGLREARAGNPPFLWTLLSHPGHRLPLLHAGWKDVGKVFSMAIVIDVGYQIYVFHWVYPLQAVIVAVTLAFLPYFLVCGPVNRIARRWCARSLAHEKSFRVNGP